MSLLDTTVWLPGQTVLRNAWENGPDMGGPVNDEVGGGRILGHEGPLSSDRRALRSLQRASRAMHCRGPRSRR